MVHCWKLIIEISCGYKCCAIFQPGNECRGRRQALAMHGLGAKSIVSAGAWSNTVQAPQPPWSSHSTFLVTWDVNKTLKGEIWCKFWLYFSHFLFLIGELRQETSPQPILVPVRPRWYRRYSARLVVTGNCPEVTTCSKCCWNLKFGCQVPNLSKIKHGLLLWFCFLLGFWR